MATADTIYEQEHCRLKDEHNLLISASEKCFLAAQKIKEQEAKIRKIRMAVGFTGTVGVCAAIVTGGASLAAAGAVLLAAFMLQTSIAKGILQSREMKNFPEEWETAKVKARRETIEQRFGAQDLQEKPHLDVHGADDLKALATIYLDKESADAVEHFLSAAASCDPQTTDRLKRLNEHQLDILFTSLTNILFADFTAFEMIIGSMALEKKDPDVVLRRVCKDIKDLAEKVCKREGESFPALWATVNGKFVSPRGHWGDQQFSVDAFIWDKRLLIKDFIKDIPIPPNAKSRPLQLLNYRDNTVLRVSVRKQPGQHLAPDEDGHDLTEKEKIFDLHRQLPCDECLNESKSVPMWHNWLLCTRNRDTPVTVCISFEHIGREQQSATSQILCHIKRDDAIPPEVVETLQGMDARQNKRAAQEMGISPAQLQSIVRHLEGDGPANNDGGAQAAGSQPSASAHRRLSQDSPEGSSRRRQSERLPLGIQETREVGQTDDQEIHSPPAAAISPNWASETTHPATRLDELKFE